MSRLALLQTRYISIGGVPLPCCSIQHVVSISSWSCQAVISQEQGGHRAPVHSFQSLGSFLFSSDRLGIIKARIKSQTLELVDLSSDSFHR